MIIWSRSICMCAAKILPNPQNITDTRSWFRLINKVECTFIMTVIRLPLRRLLTPDISFLWVDTLQQLFEDSKAVILAELCKGREYIFHQTKYTSYGWLVWEWHRRQIAAEILRRSSQPYYFCCHTGWQIVLFGNRFTHSADSRTLWNYRSGRFGLYHMR